MWKATCFEAFLRAEGGEAYREWNFAPSGDWAAYDFTACREGMAEAGATAPYIRMEDNLTWWALGATIAVPADQQWQLGLSAVLEEKDGTKSYWALAHPDLAYRQPKDVHTGAYGDEAFDDEFAWAAAELYLLTGDEEYRLAFGRHAADAGMAAEVVRESRLLLPV